MFRHSLIENLKIRYFRTYYNKNTKIDIIFIKSMTIKRINLFLGIAGLSFQAFILLPWHHIISEQMDELESDLRRVDVMNKELVDYLSKRDVGKIPELNG